MHQRKITRILCMAVALLCGLCIAASATVIPYTSFTYIYKSGELRQAPCPAPFVPSRVLDAASLGVPLGMPNDLFVTEQGDFYIVDTANSAILVLAADYTVKKVITTFMLDGETSSFNKPEGVFVKKDGTVYVADTENNRVVVLDSNDQGVRTIVPEKSDVLGASYIFYPRKIAVDNGNRVFVVARDQFNGIMQFTAEGQFASFVGSNMVTASPVELLWKRLMTKEQREKTMQFIPLEYCNLSLDADGFIYAVTQATGESKKVKRLNPGGADVLVRSTYDAMITKKVKIADICTDAYDNYYTINQADGCVYAYNKDGYLMYAFGSLSNQIGTFQSPSSVEYFKNKLYVTDGVNGNITVFEMTDYAQTIQKAGLLYNQGQYEESRALWEQLLQKNSNFELGYIQLGRISYRLEQYEDAMRFFKQGNFRGNVYVGGYGAALEVYRGEFLRSHLSVILSFIAGIALVGTGIYLWKRFRKKKRKGEAHD